MLPRIAVCAILMFGVIAMGFPIADEPIGQIPPPDAVAIADEPIGQIPPPVAYLPPPDCLPCIVNA